MKKKHTKRGFPYYEFKDTYKETCSLQLSSLAEDRCIWLGINAPSKLAEVSPRMHLSTKQVAKLLPILQKFVETGDL